jgi:hypothetical protein
MAKTAFPTRAPKMKKEHLPVLLLRKLRIPRRDSFQPTAEPPTRTPLTSLFGPMRDAHRLYRQRRTISIDRSHELAAATHVGPRMAPKCTKMQL